MKVVKNVFYHSSRIPVDIQAVLGQKWLKHSLKTSVEHDARTIELNLKYELKSLYTDIRKRVCSQDEAQSKFSAIIKREQPATPATPAGENAHAISKDTKVIRLRHVADKLIGERLSGWSRRSKSELASLYRSIPAEFGNPDITKISREQVITWVAKMEGPKEYQPNTVGKYVGALSTLLDYAMTIRGWISINPALRIPYKKDKRAKHSITPVFTVDELAKLFYDLQLNKKEHYISRHQERYWVPVLTAYTGARINEICQLRVGDIEVIDDIPCIVFTTEEKPTQKEKAGEEVVKKSLKNENAYRAIPIHRDVLRLGFLVYVNRLMELGESSLFPSLKLGPNGFSHYFVTRWTTNSKNSSRWYMRILGEDNEKGNHNLRHTFINILAQAQMYDPLLTDKAIKEMIGHDIVGETFGRYAKPYRMKPLLRVINTHVKYNLIPNVNTEPIANCDEDGHPIPNSTSLKVSCGHVSITVDNCDNVNDVEEVQQYERPDKCGYSLFHESIPAFFPEPESTEFKFIGT